MSPESPEKGSEDSVRTVVQQHQGEEDQQDHLHVDHLKHRLPHRRDPALCPHHAACHLLQVREEGSLSEK